MRMVVLELIILDLTISQPALENLIQYMQSPLLLWRHELVMGLGGVRMGVLGIERCSWSYFDTVDDAWRRSMLRGPDSS